MLPPKARLLSGGISVAATFILDQWLPLVLAWLCVIVMLATSGLLTRYLRFAIAILTPLALMLLLMWGVIIRSPPNAPLGTDPDGALAFVAVLVLRIAVTAGLVQLVFLSIPSRLLPATLRLWGLRGDYLVAGLGAYAVMPEIALRMDQVVTAYRARGLMGGSRLSAARRIHRLLRPLFVWTVRAAVQRADTWHQRAILLRVETFASDTHLWSWTQGAVALMSSLAFLVTAAVLRWSSAF